MFKLRTFVAAVLGIGLLASYSPVALARAGGGGHGGGGHGGGAHFASGGHAGGAHFAHGGVYAVSHNSGGRAGIVHSGGGRALNYRSLGYNHGGYYRGGRDFDHDRGFYRDGFYGGYPYGYGYGYPYYDSYYYNGPSYDYAPYSDSTDPGYGYAAPALDYGAPTVSSFGDATYDYADPVQAPSQAAPLNNTAEVDVYVPVPDAQIWVNGISMATNSSTHRSFVSPPIQPGKSYSYRISAAWTENGRPMRVDRTVNVWAGHTTTLDFTTAPSTP